MVHSEPSEPTILEQFRSYAIILADSARRKPWKEVLTFGLIWTRHKGDRRTSRFQDWAWKLDVLRSGARSHWLTRSISLEQTSLLSDTLAFRNSG